MKHFRNIYKEILLFTQFGLSFIMPLLLCIGLCGFLVHKTGIGYWVYLFGFLFGLGGSFMTGYKFYVSIVKQDEKKQQNKKKRVSYNKHL
jgi:hypothetical protein